MMKKAARFSFLNGHNKEVLKGSSISLGFRVLDVAAGYVYLLIVSRCFGARGIGIYSLSLSALFILDLIATLGFKMSILRFVGQFSAQNVHHRIRSLYKNVLEISVPAAALLAFIFFVFARFLAVSVFHDETFVVPFRVIAVVAPLYVVNSVNLEIIRGLKNILFSEYLRNLNETVFNLPLLFFAARFVLRPDLPVATYALAALATFFLSTRYVSRRLRSFSKDTEGAFSKRDLLRISSPMMVTTVSFLIMGKIDALMLGIFSSAEDIGVYEIAFKLASATSFVLYAINVIAAPKISELFWAKNHEDLKEVIRFSSKLMFLFSLPFLLIFVLFPDFFLGIFGKEFLRGRHALIFLTVGQFVNAASGSVGVFLNMTGRQRAFRGIVMTATAVNVVLNYVLIPRYGLNGAAAATMVSMSLWNIWSAAYIRRKDKISTFYFPGLRRREVALWR